MYMLSGNMSLDDLHIFGFTNLPDQIPHSLGNLSPQNRLVVFCDPHDVAFQIINGMAELSIIPHTASILNCSPKGEDFSPILRMGQKLWDPVLYPFDVN